MSQAPRGGSRVPHCGRMGGLRIWMKAAASVVASATAATAARKIRWVPVPQIPSGRPRTTARPVTHNPVSPVGIQRPVKERAARPGDQQPDQDDAVAQRSVENGDADGQLQAKEEDSFRTGQPGMRAAFLSKAGRGPARCR